MGGAGVSAKQRLVCSALLDGQSWSLWFSFQNNTRGLEAAWADVWISWLLISIQLPIPNNTNLNSLFKFPRSQFYISKMRFTVPIGTHQATQIDWTRTCEIPGLMTDLLSKYPMNDRSVSHFLCETDINCLQDIFGNKLMILFWFNAKLITNRKQFSHKCSYASVFHATDYSKRQGLFCLTMLSSTLSWIIVWTQLCFTKQEPRFRTTTTQRMPGLEHLTERVNNDFLILFIVYGGCD